MTARFLIGDTRAVTATLPDGSIDLVMTSPPFLALRSYIPADHPDKGLEIGSEATPAVSYCFWVSRGTGCLKMSELRAPRQICVSQSDL